MAFVNFSLASDSGQESIIGECAWMKYSIVLNFWVGEGMLNSMLPHLLS